MDAELMTILEKFGFAPRHKFVYFTTPIDSNFLVPLRICAIIAAAVLPQHPTSWLFSHLSVFFFIVDMHWRQTSHYWNPRFSIFLKVVKWPPVTISFPAWWKHAGSHS